MIASFFQDIRYTLRQLAKTPGFTITAVLTLALGIGANAAIFTLVNAVLLKNLPVANPKTLWRLGDTSACCVISGTWDDGNYSLFPTETSLQLKKNVPEFQELAAIQAGFEFRPIIARRDGAQANARSARGEFVSGNYFRTFGLQPHAGRLLTDTDDVAGAPIAAVLSYEAWQRDYAGDPSVIGSTFWINTKAATVVGVAPKGFYGDRLSSAPPDFYLPIESMPVLTAAQYVHDPEQQWLYLIGRVKPGVAIPPLQEKLNALIRQSFAPNREFSSEQGKRMLAKVHTTLTPGGAGIQGMQEAYGSNLKLLITISGLVLLIACANIANLVLVRGMARRTELSVRTALGAMRGRILRQLLTENIVLAGLSGTAALIVAYAGTHMLLALAFPRAHSLPIHASPSGAVLGFAFALSLLTGIVFGIAPAWIASQANPADALRNGTRTTASGASLLQRSLVVLQTALSLILLVGAGLFVQSLNRLQHIDLKLNSRNRYIVHFDPQAAGYATPKLESLYRTIEERFHSIPEVKKVGISSYTPMEDNNNNYSVQIQGRQDPHATASFIKANPEYFDSVGTRLVMGRGIGPQDTSTAPAVAVVNQSFVKKLFKPGEYPIGAHFGSPGSVSTGDYEIVGVVEDTAYTDARWKDHSMCFIPLMQRPASNKQPIEKDEYLYVGAIVLETDRPIDNMESITRQTLAAINPNLSIVKFQTFDQQIADRFTEDRMIAQLTLLFGALALLLAALGLYGVTSYTVARRTSEIGIRMALGANRAGVIAMVMRGAILQTALGLAIGIPTALLCVRFIKSQLYEATSLDLSIMAGAIIALTAAACIAGLIPARRAASTDPIQALRSE